MSANLPVAAGRDPGVAPPDHRAHDKSALADNLEVSLSLADKAAIIMAALGPEAAPHVLQGVSETTMRRFAQAMSGMWRISPELLDKTIADFTDELGANREIKGGAGEARRILRELLDDDSVSRIMDDVDAGGGRTLWEKLSNSSDQALAGFLRHEHPQTATVVLSKMRSDKAARILERLDPEFAQVIVLRLARVPRLDSEVMEILKDVITREFLAVMQREQATRRPADVIGSMMNNVSASNRARLLQQLEQEKPKLARQVQKVMFTFADLSERVEARDAGLLLKAVDEPTMLKALRFAESNAPRVIDFFLSNLSKRLAQRLEGEIKQIGDVSPRDGEAAQTEVVRVARELAQQGELKLVEVEEEE
ncbi:MAG: flagellar motor switch protein FliG [Rubrimonas sp.]|uniref:flagellar motor switch protein FliG n=1 Tax=Rubrimonas sp. TaxID=2036015 RepID=UPI002FDC9430